MAEGISYGQLREMSPEARAEKIKSLSLEVRVKLAHIATLGAARLISDPNVELAKIQVAPYGKKLEHAKSLTALAAELTNTDHGMIKDHDKAVSEETIYQLVESFLGTSGLEISDIVTWLHEESDKIRQS